VVYRYHSQTSPMKKRIFLLLFSAVLLLSCKSKTPNAAKEGNSRIVVLKSEDIEAVQKKRAYDVGRRLLETCNTSRFKAFTAAEATEKVRRNATKEKIAATCQKIIARNGRFLDLTLIDVTLNKDTDEIIFRYDIIYEKKLNKRELKVTLDKEDKVSAISTKEIPKKPM
jgi:hypothetical protein